MAVLRVYYTTWTGNAGDGQWSDAANWSSGVPYELPIITFDQQGVAIIDTTASVTIAGTQGMQDLTLDAPGAFVSLTGTLNAGWGQTAGGGAFGDINLLEGTFEIDGGMLTLANVRQDGGTVTFGAATTWGASTINASIINGPVTIGNGSDVIAARYSFAAFSGANETATIVQDSTLSLEGSMYLDGTLDIKSGVLQFAGGGTTGFNGTTTIIEDGGTIAASGNASFNDTNTVIEGNWSIDPGVTITIYNGTHGTFEAVGGVGAATVDLGTGASLDINGSLTLAGTVASDGGTIVVGNGDELTGGAVPATVQGGSVLVEGHGTIDGATIDSALTLQSTGGTPELTVTGDNVFGNPTDATSMAINLGGGVIDVTGSLGLDGADVTNGTIVVEASGTLSKDAATVIGAGATIVTAKLTDWTGAAGNGLWSAAGNWSNGVPQSGALFSETGGSVAVIDNSVDTAPNTVVIAGNEAGQDVTVAATDPAGGSAVSLVGTLDLGYDDNSGTVAAGTLNLNNGTFAINGGTLVDANVAISGGTLAFGSTATLRSVTTEGNFTVGTNSSLDVQGTLTLDGSIDDAGTVTLNNGALLTAASPGSAALNGGSFTVVGSATLDGVMLDSSVTVVPAAGDTTGFLIAAGTETFGNAGAPTPMALNLGGGVLDVTGSLDLFDVAVTNGSVVVEAGGSLTMDAASVAALTASVTYATTTDWTGNAGDGQWSDSGNWSNGVPVAGAAFLKPGGSVATIDNSVDFVANTVTIEGLQHGQTLVVDAANPAGGTAVSLLGTLDLGYAAYNGTTATPGLLTLTNGTFGITGGELQDAVTQGGTMLVTGTGTLDAVTVASAITLEPAAGTSTGVLVATGTDVIAGPTSASAMALDLGGGILDVTGTLDLTNVAASNGRIVVEAGGSLNMDGATQAALTASVTYATTTDWTGKDGNNQWNDPGNWDNGVPVSAAPFLHPGGVIANINSVYSTVTIGAGGTVGYAQQLSVYAGDPGAGQPAVAVVGTLDLAWGVLNGAWAAGTLDLVAGHTQIDGGLLRDATVVEEGGTIDFAATATLDNVAVQGNVTIDNASTVIASGRDSIAGVVTIDQTSALSVAGSLGVNGTIDNAGTVTLANGGTLAGGASCGVMQGGGTLLVNGSGTIDGVTVETAITLEPPTGSATDILTAAGNDAITGPAGSGPIALNLNGGVLDVTGSLDLTNVDAYNGTIIVEAGGTLTMDATTQSSSSATIIQATTDDWTGNAGDNLWSNANNWSSGVPISGGPFLKDGGSVAVIGNGSAIDATATIDGNEVGQDVIVNALDPASGGPAVSLRGLLDLASTFYNGYDYYGSLKLQAGTFEIDGGTLAIAGVQWSGGTLAFGDQSTYGSSTLLGVVTHGDFTIGNDSHVIATGGDIFNGNTVDYSPATVSITGNSTLSVESDLYVRGTVDIQSGVMSLDGGGLSSYGNAAVIQENGGTFEATANASLTGVTIDGNWAINHGETITAAAASTDAFQTQGLASPVFVTIDNASTLDVAGTLNLAGTIAVGTGTVRVEGTIDGGTIIGTGGSAEVLLDPSGTATLNGVTVDTNMTLATTGTGVHGLLLVTGNTVFGNGSGTTVDLSGGTLDVQGSLTLDGVMLENGTVLVQSDGSLTIGAGTTFDNVTGEQQLPTGTSTLSGQNVTVDIVYTMAAGDTLAVTTGATGDPTAASGTPGTFDVSGAGGFTGAGTVIVTDANGGPSTSVISGNLTANVSGETLWIDSANITVGGTNEATNGGTLELGDPNAAVAAGQADGVMAYHGPYVAQANSTIILDSQGPITGLTSTVTLDGAGSTLDSGSGGTVTPLEQSLVTLDPYSLLALAGGRDFAAQNGLTLDSGFITLTGGILSAPTITGEVYFPSYGGIYELIAPEISGYGTIDAAIAGRYVIDAIGGTLTLNGPLVSGPNTGYGSLIAGDTAGDSSTLIINSPLTTADDGQSTGDDLEFYSNATIQVSGSVSPAYVNFYGTNSILDLSDAAGNTIGVYGTALTKDGIDLVGLAAAVGTGGSPEVTIKLISSTSARVTITPASDPSSPVVLNITGNVGQTGLSAVDDGNGGTLIQFAPGPNAAQPVIEPGANTTGVSNDVFQFTDPVHQNVEINGTVYGGDLIDRLDILNYNGTANEGLLAGSVLASTSPLKANGSFTGLVAGYDTGILAASGTPYGTNGSGTPVTVTLDTRYGGLVTGYATIDFTSTDPTTQQTSQLPSQTVTVEAKVYDFANADFTQQVFYARGVAGQESEELFLPVTDLNDAPGYTEGLVATIVGSSGDFTGQAGLADPAGTTALVAAGDTNSNALGFWVDTNPDDFPGGRDAVQTGVLDVRLTSNGDGTSNLGTTDLGTVDVPVEVKFAQYADPQVEKPQVFYVDAYDNGAGNPLWKTLSLTVANGYTADVEENLIASVDSSTSGTLTFNDGQTTPPITAGGSNTTSITFKVDVNADDFGGGRGEVQTGTVDLKMVSSGVGIDNLGTTVLSTIDVPVEVVFDGVAQPEFNLDYYVHATKPSTGGAPSTTTVDFQVGNKAPASNHVDNLVATVLKSSGDFTLGNGTFDVAFSPTGTTEPIPAQQINTGGIQFDVVTDADVVSIDPSGSVQTGTFDMGLASVATGGSGSVLQLPTQEVGVKVTVQDYADPVIEGLNDPINDAYSPTPGTPLTETINLGVVLEGSYTYHAFQFTNEVDSEYEDSLGVTSSLEAVNGILPGQTVIDGGIYAAGSSLGVHSQTVVFTPVSENPTSNTNLTPVDVTYTWTVVPVPKTAIAWGDVHITTFDGVAYNFQAQGEFVLAQSTLPGDNFQVQIRTAPFGTGSTVSVITAVSIQIGSDTVNFDLDRAANSGSASSDVVFVDGVASAISNLNAVLTLSGGTVTQIGNSYIVAWNTGESMTLTNGGTYLSVTSLGITAADAGNVEGLLGPANGGIADFLLANGTPISNNYQISQTDLYGAFANAWRVTQASSLLDYYNGETTASFTDVNFPTDAIALADLPSSVQTQAASVVAAAGITDPVLQQEAELDYVMTGSTSFLNGAQNVQQQGGTSTAADVTTTATPPPSVGVQAAASTQTVEAAGVTPVTFAVYSTSTVSTPTTIDYQVVAPGAGYLGASAFPGGTLPSGSVVIPANSTSGSVTIDVPLGALGTTPTDLLEVTISSPGSVDPVIAPSAGTTLINASPEPGTPPTPAVAALGGDGTVTTSPNTLSVALGSYVLGESADWQQFQISNLTATTVDNPDSLGGTVAYASGSGFSLAGNGALPAIAAGSNYQGLYVLPDTSTLGSNSEAITFAPTDENATGYSSPLTVQTIDLADTIVAAAEPTLLSPGTIDFGDVHGGTVVVSTLDIANTAAAGAAGLDVSIGIIAGGFGSGGYISQLAAGAENKSSLTINVYTGSGSVVSGTAQLTYTSDAGDRHTLADGSATIALMGAVYNYATASLPSAEYFHIGSPGSIVLPIANTAAAGDFSERLTGSVVATSGVVVTSGSIGEIAAQTTSDSLNLTVSTAAAGIGTVTLDLVSDGTGIDTLGTTDLGHQTVAVYVDNLAAATVNDTNGVGTVTRNGSDTTIDLGKLGLDTGLYVVQPDVVNSASGPADLLSGTFSVSGDPEFTNYNLGPFSGLGAGQADTAPEVMLDTNVLGAFSETITLDLTGSNAGGYSGALGTQYITVEGTVLTVACYARGTHIATPTGEVVVEDLAIGDLVATASGAARPIRWIGRRSYLGRFAARNKDVLPVLIRAGALADGVPARDLTVSSLHAMYVDGLLVPAAALVNGVSIIQHETIDRIDYVHIEFDSHDVILAEGAPSESFVDDDSRQMFHNAADYAARYPDAPRLPAVYCAPRLTEGFAVEAIRQRLAVRAGISAPPPEMPLAGFVDHVGADVIEGWAQNPDAPEVPVCLDVLVDGVLVAQTLASRYRDDLQAAGLGSGRHSFALRLAAPLTWRQRQAVVVRRSADQRTLPLSDAGAVSLAA